MSKQQPISALIVDDSAQARVLLHMMISELAPGINIIGQADNANNALALISNAQPQLIFLDIEMPGKSGLQLVHELAAQNNPAHIVFTTAYNQYAIQAFRLSAIDYLLKPIRENHLLEAIEKVSQQIKLQHSAQKLDVLASNLEVQSNNTLSIPVNYGYEYLPVNDIEYIEAERAYAHIGMKDGSKKLVSKTLKYFEEALQHLDCFVKIHRSYLVNINYISSFSKADRGIITLQSGKKTELSRSHRKEFLEILEKLNKHF